MAVKIRLTRTGKKKQPSYRVVVADSRAPRDGRYIEQIGRYHPLLEPSEIVIDNDRAAYWLSVGAQPSDAVRKLLQISGALEGTAAPKATPTAHDPKVHVVGEEAQIEAAADDAELAAAAAAEAIEEIVEEAAEEAEVVVADAVEAAEAVVEEVAEAADDGKDQA